MRDNNYLQGRLDYIWDRYFSDIDQANDVIIQFGKKARNRLGSIKQSRIEQITNNKYQITNISPNGSFRRESPNPKSQTLNPTIITITGLFKDETIPEFIVDSVIAHEMVHYAHGFASPHEKKYENPHAGGVIKKEMVERGLEDLFILQKKWIKENWESYLKENAPRPLRYRKRRKRRLVLFR